jgi:hypothetical protein
MADKQDAKAAKLGLCVFKVLGFCALCSKIEEV